MIKLFKACGIVLGLALVAYGMRPERVPLSSIAAPAIQPPAPDPPAIEPASKTPSPPAGGGDRAESFEQNSLQKLPKEAGTGFSPFELEMLAENNRIRALAIPPLPPQQLDLRLCQAAQDQAEYLARTGKFDHYVNGNPRRRAAARGFPVSDENDLGCVQENIAGGATSVPWAFYHWRTSPGHYAAILKDRPLCGFGLAGNRWVSLYGQESHANSFQVLAEQQPQPAQFPEERQVPAQAPAQGLAQAADKGYQQAPTQAPAKGYQQAPAAQCAGGVCYAPQAQYAAPRAYQPRGKVRARGCGGNANQRPRFALLPWRR